MNIREELSNLVFEMWAETDGLDLTAERTADAIINAGYIKVGEDAIERAAQALYESYYPDPNERPAFTDYPHREEFLTDARAVVKALKGDNVIDALKREIEELKLALRDVADRAGKPAPTAPLPQYKPEYLTDGERWKLEVTCNGRKP